jgi:hypothetical protein
LSVTCMMVQPRTNIGCCDRSILCPARSGRWYVGVFAKCLGALMRMSWAATWGVRPQSILCDVAFAGEFRVSLPRMAMG